MSTNKLQEDAQFFEFLRTLSPRKVADLILLMRRHGNGPLEDFERELNLWAASLKNES